MSLLATGLGFQHTIRTPIGYAPGVTSALSLGYGLNSKMSAGGITNGLDIIRDADRVEVSSKIRNREVSREIDRLIEYETEAKTVSDGLEAAKANFQTIKNNVNQIKDIVKNAETGLYTDLELDEQQEVINNLVLEIQDLVDTTEIDGNKVFDGTYNIELQTGLSNTDNFNVDFTLEPLNAAPPGVEAVFQAGNVNDRMGDAGQGRRDIVTTEDYIITTALFADNAGDESNTIGKIYVYDRNDGTLLHELTGSDPQEDMKLGLNMVYDEDTHTLFAGASNFSESSHSPNGAGFKGRVYAFDLTPGGINEGTEKYFIDGTAQSVISNRSEFGFRPMSIVDGELDSFI